LSRHDTNGDGIITEAEYLKDPFVEFDPDELADRRRVFRQGFDADKVNLSKSISIELFENTIRFSNNLKIIFDAILVTL